MNNIKIILLAAGNSSRFWPLTNKSTFPFLGKPFIKHQLETLFKVGFSDISVVCNEENINYIKTLHPDYVLQKGEGQGAGIYSAKDKIKGPVLVINAIDFFSLDFLKNSYKTINENSINNYFTAVKVDKYFPGGYLVLKDNRVAEIREKPGKDKIPSNLFRLVFDYFQNGSELINALQKVKDFNYEKSLNYLLQKEVRFSVLEYHNQWGTLKYPWHVLDFTRIFLDEIKKSQISQNTHIAPSTSLQGPIVMEEGVRIFENAKIVGPCYLGKNVIIGNNCLVREAIIEEGSVLGFSTDIARSYVGKNCWFHSNYLGDSVLEENISLGAGANLANLRLDEKEIFSVVKGEKINSQRTKFGAVIGRNVRIGVNTSLMPGIKIGTNSFLSSGIIIDRDIPDNKFVTGKSELVIRDNLKKIEKGREEFKNKI